MQFTDAELFTITHSLAIAAHAFADDARHLRETAVHCSESEPEKSAAFERAALQFERQRSDALKLVEKIENERG